MNNLTQRYLGKVQDLLGQGTTRQLQHMIRGLQPVEIARLIESSPPAARRVIWDLADTATLGEIIESLPEDIRSEYLEGVTAEGIAELTEGLETDNLVDILQDLPEHVIEKVLEAMDQL